MRRSLSEADVKNAFEVFAEQMANGTSLEQLETAETMVFFISNYLRQCMPDINLTGLLILGEELSDIGNKKKPTFISHAYQPNHIICLSRRTSLHATSTTSLTTQVF